MGSTGRLFLVGGPRDLETRLRSRLHQLEMRWSRFVDSSDVSRANANGGAHTLVSADTLLLVKRALQASQRTRGWFDPTLLQPLVEAGYDRSFSELDPCGIGDLVVSVDHRSPTSALLVHDWEARCRLIGMDPAESTITVPAGMGFDPGGLGKGLAADLIAAEAVDSGASAVVVDLGGDLVLAGHAPDGGWTVGLEDPFDTDRRAATVRLPWGAVATSTKSKRRWRSRDGDVHHHLIDPATQAASTSDAMSATVIAGTCWQAESFAKAAVLAGLDAGLDLLEASGVEGLMIDFMGNHHVTAGMGAYLDRAAV